MIHITPAASQPRDFPGLLDEVRRRGDSVLITENGKPVAALIDIGLLDRLCSRAEEFATLRAEFSAAFADLSEAEFGALLDEALSDARGAARIATQP
jgi:prevent-host-death family protein